MVGAVKSCLIRRGLVLIDCWMFADAESVFIFSFPPIFTDFYGASAIHVDRKTEQCGGTMGQLEK